MKNHAKRTPAANAGFTFVEVLVAMVFMGVVIPVAVEGILLANRAGSVAERKRIATELADAKLTELVVTDEWRYGVTGGEFDGITGYTWEVQNTPWQQDGILELAVAVTYQSQGRDYVVELNTLVPEEEESTTETTTQVTASQ